MAEIQGKNAILKFYKNGYLPFLCATEFTLSIATEKMPIRTVGDGHFKKNTYQTGEYTLALSNLLFFDEYDQEENFNGQDLIERQLGFTSVLWRLTYTDDNGLVRSFQGEAMIEASSVGARPGEYVSGDFSLAGNGKLDFYEGEDPCPTEVTNVVFSDLDTSDGNIAFAFAYNGSPLQIEWFIDRYTENEKSGISAPNDTVFVDGMTTGTHTIEAVPRCGSNFTGISFSEDFITTGAQTCDINITSVDSSVSGQQITLTVNYTGGDPGSYVLLYRDAEGGNPPVQIGGQWPIDQPIVIDGNPLGDNNFTLAAYCSNNLLGETFEKTVTILGVTLRVWYQNGLTSANMNVQRNGITIVLWASPNTQDFVIISTDTIRATLTGLAPRRLVISDSDFNVLYNVATPPRDFTIPTLVDGKTYFITAEPS
jgi:hypothetical protein